MWSTPNPRTCTSRAWRAINGGCGEGTPAFNVNRLCGSGLQAIVSAAQAILLGDTDIAIGGGAENMSRAPYASLASRWGARMGDSKMVDMMVGALHDPFHTIHMGITAENIAAKWGITREDQDKLAVESHNRAERATQSGVFKSQIMPVMLKSKKGDVAYATDEHFRPDCHDGRHGQAQARVPQGKRHRHGRQRLGHQRRGRRRGADGGLGGQGAGPQAAGASGGLRPRRRGPQVHGHRPGAGQQKALEKAGLTVNDLDVIEANEAFAAQACAVTRDLGLDPAKVNPNGSGISLGHPIGATGALITVKALYELERIGGRYALVTMCIGGGQGIAAIFERS